MKDTSLNNDEYRWKKELSEILIKLRLIERYFVGKIIININQGGITDVEKVQRMK